MTETLNIPEYFGEQDVDNISNVCSTNFEKSHVAVFQMRKNVNLEQPIALAMELPHGAFISGSFMRKIINKKTDFSYDIFFSGQESFQKLLLRIHLAGEGMFLHGYESDKTPKEFAEGFDKYLTFTHPTKPAIKLHRARWFRAPEDLLDSTDFVVNQVALDHNLTITYSNRAIDDCTTKSIRIWRAPLQVSTGLRILKLEEEGYLYSNGGGNYDRYSYDDIKNKGLSALEELRWKAEDAGVPEADRPTLHSLDTTYAHSIYHS